MKTEEYFVFVDEYFNQFCYWNSCWQAVSEKTMTKYWCAYVTCFISC